MPMGLVKNVNASPMRPARRPFDAPPRPCGAFAIGPFGQTSPPRSTRLVHFDDIVRAWASKVELAHRFLERSHGMEGSKTRPTLR